MDVLSRQFRQGHVVKETVAGGEIQRNRLQAILVFVNEPDGGEIIVEVLAKRAAGCAEERPSRLEKRSHGC